LNAWREQYTGSFEVETGTFVTMSWVQWYLSENGTGYVITYTALPETVNKQLATAEKMATTFLLQ
jgi:hypothetical protein